MFKVGDYVVYNNSVCKIIEIRKKRYNNLDYYFMRSIDDNSLKIEIPINNKLIRKVITKEQVLELINKIPSINTLEDSGKMMENSYKL